MLTREQAIEVLDAVKELSVNSESYKNYIEQIIDCIAFGEHGYDVWGLSDEEVEQVYETLTAAQSEEEVSEDK